ncbi:DUF2800 domain-containing protein [Ruminococcus flavefaciens]|uniref:DUF2800 domain-containing protein n=1 Tax=Ruminococcus flavefaciens TaxID=1265 RepID=UPI0026EB1898|nr:DUF2800 domain-containing protein [Ruminococcus flavefaciens]MDD7517090.1 DUF2800 domain-containing protein [Ruminococcus flavefaciens]MDY5692085.1 DUF2800 domain-containing protein [Ruminococcus flavefaciens]
MPDVHALLSASSSKQWLHCPPSVRLQENFPNESSVYAAEGTYAHEVCEYKVRKYLKERVKRPQSKEYDTEEIEQITDVYAEFVISIIEKMKENGCEPLAFVEERVDYSHIAPSGFGTADMLIIGKDEQGRGILHVCDFKTGAGVFVDADHNSQMMLYAIGALAAYGFLYDIEIVRMSIIQPRLDNISTFECSRQELEDWGESIKPIAKLAYEGKGEQHPGDWCRFCRAKPVCKACADEALALCREDFLDLDAGAFDDTAEESDMTAPYEADTQTAVFKQPGLIPISELAEIIPTLNRISSWIEAVFAFVSSEAINHGVPIPGYKVVEGRSKRVFTDTKAVVDVAVQNGYTDLYKQTLITLTEFEKMMGKKKFNELLGEYVAKPPGKLALVPESDPREPVDLTATPDQEFSALPDEE